MNERVWQRLGASMAILWVVLVLGNFIVVPIPPRINDSTSIIAAYFSENYGRMQFNAVLGALSGLALLWFAGHLRHLLQRAEGGAEAFSPIVFGSAVVFAVFNALRPLPFLTLAMVTHQSEAGGNGTVIRALYDVHAAFNGAIGFVTALFLATVGIAMTRGELGRPWLGWFGILAALLALTNGIADFYAASTPNLANSVGILTIVILGVWFLITGAVMISRPEVERTASMRAVFTQ
jgi:hypothetical protein